MKQYLILLGMAFCVAGGHAQNNKTSQADPLTGANARKDLKLFRDSVFKDFNAFRKQCWEEYSEYLRQVWKEYKGKEAEKQPVEKEAPPVVLPPLEQLRPVTIRPEDRQLNFNKVITLAPPQVEPQPQPVEPVEEVPMEFGDDKFVEFMFYGTPLKVRFDLDERVPLRGIDENSVADAMQEMTSEYYDNMLFDCLKLRDELQLSDWAYLQMLEQLSYAVCGLRTNEAVVLLTNLYVQSGYRMRLASDGSRLYVLFGSKHQMWDRVAFLIDGENYYALEKGITTSLHVSNAVYPKEQSLSLVMRKNMKLANQPTKKREIASKRYSDFKATVSINGNFLKYYEEYPPSYLNGDVMSRWAMFANSPLQEEVRAQLYPVFREKLKGLSQLEAVERLLNWVQTGLEYKLDDLVWGQDRIFFSEESLFYDFCDCEDRSILLTRMVRDLLGLECILIYYPGHLASAVAFTETGATGDYILLNDKRFYIADGAYIGACVGMTMTNMNNASAQVILLE